MTDKCYCGKPKVNDYLCEEHQEAKEDFDYEMYKQSLDYHLKMRGQ